MKTSHLYLLLFSSALLISNNLQGQNYEEQLLVQKIYDALQDRNTSSQDVAALVPVVKWKEIKTPEGINQRTTITFRAIMTNHWSSILFRDLKFDYIVKNKIMVTGEVTGRQPSECEYISTRFRHYWSLKNGEIVAFSEKQRGWVDQ